MAICLIGAAAFARMSALILAIVIVCVVAVVISYIAQVPLEVHFPFAVLIIDGADC